MNNSDSNENIAQIGARVIAVLNERMQLGGMEAHVGASVGIAVLQDATDSAEGLLKRADDAMYAAKAAGKNVVRFAV